MSQDLSPMPNGRGSELLHEKDLERGLLNQLQQFLLELGRGFAFVARQKHLRAEADNPTLGLILCSARNSAVAKYSLLADNPQLFASKYRLILPTEAELRAERERDRTLLEDAFQSHRGNDGGNAWEILSLLSRVPEMSTPDIAVELGESESTVGRAIRKLRHEGKLKRIGPDKGGHWEVIP